jgi:hypothetical protein
VSERSRDREREWDCGWKNTAIAWKNTAIDTDCLDKRIFD